jgi:adenylate cyclase
LNSFNARQAALGFQPIAIGIGICTAEVISGNIGSERRMDFTVVGDGVNIASRLESLTKQYGTDILITETTHEEVRDHFATRLVDYVVVKGKRKPVAVFEVLGECGTPVTAFDEFFDQGLRLYHRREFEPAARAFARVEEKSHLCRVFLNRCLHFQDHPPPAEWDGVWVSPEK